MPNRFTKAKYGGDDIYSWAVFEKGRVISELTGLSRDQANYYIKLLTDKRNKEISDANLGHRPS